MKPARYASAEGGALQLARLLTSEKKIANVSKSRESSLSPAAKAVIAGRETQEKHEPCGDICGTSAIA